ncbi:uncharacterized protein LOC124458109 [Xenia sp. Carnegie-2017]|uniref:uncharacterized protein LOC124458109 n=1 Tax=Xenia sp. Carnegie-2017 TaxID=2897299 RepID=UPI001F045A67|nr:uncharacterized protein LOC124458109 [Xenia sp. Carnegie-2017]
MFFKNCIKMLLTIFWCFESFSQIMCFNFCFDSSHKDQRLQGNIFKKIDVTNEMECIVSCAKEPCCRSINHRRKFSQGRWSLCEMLHTDLNNSKENDLKHNRFYDYIFLNSPFKEYNKTCELQSSFNKSYDLLFPNAHAENMILMDNMMPNMSEITLVFWIKMNSSQRMALFSYAIEDSPDEFFVGFQKNWLIIRMQSKDILKLNIPQINNGFWHHLAIIIGHMDKKIILDGFKIYNTTKLNNSLPLLHGGGVVAIGQKLECVNGVFDPKMSFVGKISYLNLWNNDVTRDKSCHKMLIIDECTSGLNENTFVIKWNLMYQFASGNVIKVPSLAKFGFSSCKEALKDDSAKDGVYLVKTKTSLGYSKVFCKKTISGCSGEGWTLVMKIDGNKKTFDFDSSLWKNKNSYNIENGKTGVDNLETKIPTYWSTNINKICVGMRFKGETNFISIDFHANSLYDVIADGKYHQTNVSRNKWMSLITDSALQPNCNKEGFNVFDKINSHPRVRIGIIGNNEKNCRSSDSFIGFGCTYERCTQNAQINSCGNTVFRHNKEQLKSMGYIFVL